MMLDAPPAAAITYVNDSSGLYPSVYGGGGSPSSLVFPGPSLLGSASEALVSATIDPEEVESRGSSGGGGAKAGRDPEPDSETLGWVRSTEDEAKKREENGGGPTEKEPEADASDGECGGGAV